MRVQTYKLQLDADENEIRLADEEMNGILASEIISQIDYEQLNKLFKFDKRKIKEVESGDIVEYTAEINIT